MTDCSPSGEYDALSPAVRKTRRPEPSGITVRIFPSPEATSRPGRPGNEPPAAVADEKKRDEERSESGEPRHNSDDRRLLLTDR